MGFFKKNFCVKSLMLCFFFVCGVVGATQILKPASQKKKSLSALKEECAHLCEKALSSLNVLAKKALDCQEKTVTVFKRVVDDDSLVREELEKNAAELRAVIQACEACGIHSSKL